MDEIRIPYKPNKIIFILAIAFFGACAGIMGNVAITNNKGLILNRIIELSPQGATIFYWVISSGAAVFVLLGFIVLIQSAVSKKEIVLSEAALTSPKNGFSNKLVTIKYSDITNIYVQNIQKTKILNIEYLNGKLSIPNSMLPNKRLFEEFISQLTTRVNG